MKANLFASLVKISCVSLISLCSLNLWAERLLVVSDIDDTLKITHALDKWDMINNSPRTDSLFLGTNLMLNLLISENPDSKIYYVSNAPDWLMQGIHENFLKENRFPKGPALLRSFFDPEDFKVMTIIKLIEEHRPEVLVAIGDNGELDVQVYDRIKKLFPKIEVLTSIHLVYSSANSSEDSLDGPKKIEKDQKPWVTALDLGLTWQKANLIETEGFNRLGSLLLQQMSQQNPDETHGVIAFPQWMDCSDIMSRKIPSFVESLKNPWFKEYLNLIKQRCAVSIE